jgi:NADPH:quinone reductase-like Zn-dependent oxidoreductase/SAM-dependent methyltransferase
MAVGLSSDSVRKYLPGDGSLCVGCVNSPKSVTVSGDCSSIPATEAELTKDGIFTRRLKVNVAYHSHHMNDIADIYRNSIQDLKMDEVVDARMISTVTGNLVTREDICNPEYWVQNMISPVLFSEAASKLIAGFSDIETSDMVNHFPAVHDIVEIGPHSALRGPIGDIIAAVIAPHDIGYHSLLVRGQSELYTLTKVIGALFCRGYSLNIDRYNRPSSNELVPTLVGLPEYPFNHSQRYWHESRLSKEGWRFRRAPLLDLLGSPVPDWNPREARWRRIMKTSQMPWIQDHVINGVAVYPASGMIVMAIEAIRQLAGSEGMPVGYSLKDVMFKKPMSIPAGEDGIETQLHLRSLNVPSDKVRTWCQFRVFSYGNENWTEHCSGNIRIDYDIARNEPHFVEEIMKHTSKCQDNYQRMATQCSRTVSSKFIYEHLNSCGFQYGPTFQALQEVAGCETTESVAHVRVFDGGNGSANVLQPHIIHPITLDAVAQLMLIALTRTGLQSIPTTVPTSVPNLWVSESGLNCSEATTIVASSTAKFTGRRKAESRTVVFDEQHQRVLLTMDIETTAVTTNTNPFQSSASSQLCYRFALKPDINLLSQRELSTLASVARPRRSSMSRFYAELEIAQQSLMKNAVAAIDNHCPTDLQPHHQLYIRWARTRICHTPSDLGGFRTLEDLYRSVESSGTQGKLFMTLGRVLEDALRGDVDPLQILFSEDDLLAARYYEYCNQDLLCNEPLIEILQFMAHKNPRLKVLEIGAGTGAATSIAIQALSDQEGGAMFTSYDYTDTSPSFFDAAEEKFGWCSKAMNFRVLDIDYAPSDQGYQSGMYDLIIAGGVLHATQDLQRTLIHVRSLLKPGGKLVLYEIVQNSRWIQFAFGLLPGWWQSTDDYRIEGPCVGVEKWDQLLKATGFTGVDVDIPDFEDPACHQFSIMLSTAVEPKPGTDSKITRNIVIVLAQDSPSQCQLAHSIYKEVKALGQPDCEILKLQQAVSYESSSKPLFLLLSDFGEPFLADIDATSFNQLQQFIARAHQILWVYPDLTNTSNPQSSMIEGFSRVLRSEFETLDLTLLALASYDTETLGVHCVIKVLREMSSNADYEPEYVVKDNLVHIRRLVEDHSLSRRMSTCGQHTTHQMKAFGDGPPLILDIATPGLLDSLEFIEDPDYKSPLGPLEIEIAVQATGINFRDCLTALGQIDGKVLGGECAGRVTAIGSAVITDLEIGDCVIGCEVNTFRTLTRCIPERVTKVPPGMSFAEAASIPITFVTAHYSFYHVARLQPGESVLIHLGAGATGQAAIQIAKHIRAVVYTTVGSEKKKQMLSEEYGIPADHIFYSRNTSFADAIRRKTEGRGVDVVLNSLAGESMYASWDCLAPFGRFVEIGKKDVLDRSQLPMFNFSRNTAFAVVDLSLILLERPSLARESLEEVLQMMKDGRLHVARPLTVYGVGEIGTAFRSLQSGQNMGKMVIELRSDDIVKVCGVAMLK